ncbi:uncharacterized protein LOC110444948, partial [Mizuhopecten yessoensis]|uniref:uncharacterized protein LOC110444948 n=1 Tax=Mizuhopecten yessoensis TaxID=6573 RepID=UPI000B458FD1
FPNVCVFHSQARQSGADNHVQTNSTSRTLDTLACVAAEKQRRPFSTFTNIRTLGHVILDVRPSTVKGRTIIRPSTSFSVNGRSFARSKSEKPIVTARLKRQVLGYICEYPMTPDVSFSPDNMDNKSDISLSRLSTTCLGAEMKVRLNETLEPSCTFHLFPSESVLEGPPIILKTAKPILWNPSTSSPVHRKDSRRETMVSSPFRGYVKVIDPNVDYKPKMKLILNKEDAGKVDFPVIKSKNGMLVAADINLSDQAKFKEESMQQKSHEGTVLPEKKSSSASYEKTSKLFCTKNLRSRFAGYIKGKKTRASALRKSENAANNRNAYSARVVRSDRSDLPNSLRGESVSPGLNYWTEEPEEYTNETKPGNAVSISTIESSESMKRVAEYILRENNSVGINATSQEVNSDSLTPRDGMWFDSAGRAYVSLAARYDPLKK